MKISVVLLILFFSSRLTFGQEAAFIESGKVIFEKRVNTHALIRKEISNGTVDPMTMEQYSAYQHNFPQFCIMLSSLTFSKNKTLFEPTAADQRPDVMSNHPAVQQTNIVYTDLAKKQITSQKRILNEVFLLKDTLKKISWRITGETRDIAGYTCRRANALIMDSVYVVAFYSELILADGGPESFSGLPGMILGVVLPRQNISWFAREVVPEPAKNDLTPPVKGRILTFKDLIILLESPALDKRIRSVKQLLLL